MPVLLQAIWTPEDADRAIDAAALEPSEIGVVDE